MYKLVDGVKNEDSEMKKKVADSELPKEPKQMAVAKEQVKVVDKNISLYYAMRMITTIFKRMYQGFGLSIAIVLGSLSATQALTLAPLNGATPVDSSTLNSSNI
ncbi:hypothetical protein KA037_00620 [Patescibacteria group bacterium]|nr:hypothetical protein [Patescibacteria group bacterium]